MTPKVFTYTRGGRIVKRLACVLVAIMVIAASGCKDITGTYKPGSFGKTPREKAMVEAVTEKYGDLTQKGDPRFLEARMTSSVEDFVPVDTVSKYSKDAQKIFAWFVYDNFSKDDIEVEWIYLDNDHSIHTFKEKSGDDFGRGAFILERPDDGWPLGNYKVIIRGRGIQEVLTFGIHEGATVATPLSLENGKFALSPTPGWHFTHGEVYMNPMDVSLVGGRRGTLIGTTDVIWDYTEGKGEKNSHTTTVTRKYDNGKVIASGSATTTWIDPPTYFGGDETPTVKVDRVVESDWGIPKFNIHFDLADINPGGATASYISFVGSNGETHVQTFQGNFQMEKAVKGKAGDKRAIILYLEGYGYKYCYEWKEQ